MQQLISKKAERTVAQARTGGIRRVKYETRFGEGILYWHDGELVATSLPGVAPEPASLQHLKAGRQQQPSEPHTDSEILYARLLESYFRGEPAGFPLDDIPLGRLFPTPFQLDVIRALAAVSYGRTTSYGELAAEAGYPQAHRAVGNLMAANPLPLILPCHRVLKSDGRPGRFSAGDEWKPRLLELEGFIQ
ncbi:MAG: methylated-DNA--[protein]-cysteine S-methyltransferase [Actinobacteria bacterium]|nr:methylated-DNA--[protein]-cysteine S-methyltransferase [Actinomycetota bacterium]